jgi:hypothetical protein
MYGILSLFTIHLECVGIFSLWYIFPFDIFRRARISIKKEAPVNFLTDSQEGRSILRTTDVLVHEWVGGKYACVDLTEVSPLAGLGTGDFTAGHAALKATSNKVAKHEKACSDNQHVFIPFAFDTFDFLAPEVVDLLKRVQRVMHNNIVSPRSLNVFFRRICFVIQKDLAAQLIVRIPFNPFVIILLYNYIILAIMSDKKSKKYKLLIFLTILLIIFSYNNILNDTVEKYLLSKNIDLPSS